MPSGQLSSQHSPLFFPFFYPPAVLTSPVISVDSEITGKRCQHSLAKPVAFPWQQSKHCQELDCCDSCFCSRGLQAETRTHSGMVAQRPPLIPDWREAVSGRAPSMCLTLLWFGLAGTFGMHIVPKQEQVLAFFAALLASSFLTPSFAPKYET